MPNSVTAPAKRPAPKVPAKVFITGANGFIGKALAGRLRELGAEVVGVDLVPDLDAGIVAGSTTDPTTWGSALTDCDVVIHMAAIVSNVAPLDAAWEVNVLGTHRTLRAAAAAGVKRFVHFSSIAAYGFDYPDQTDEMYPIRVNGHTYTDTKVNGEAVVLAAHAAGEIDCTIIRPGDVYGPGSVWIVEPIKLAKANQMILPRRGEGIFTPIYIDDFVDGMVLAISSDKAVGEIFILTDGTGVTTADFFGRIAKMAGGRLIKMPSAVAVRLASAVGAAQRRLGMKSELNDATMQMLSRPGAFSIAKARNLLGFEPLVDLDEGMARSEIWARSEGLI
ncbi:MAG: NAD-dependent epimerase/dehydratase family protein [Candidatus Nanopelagicales bacterium]